MVGLAGAKIRLLPPSKQMDPFAKLSKSLADGASAWTCAQTVCQTIRQTAEKPDCLAQFGKLCVPFAIRLKLQTDSQTVSQTFL